jgi:endonuclease YncB( thermonuclease family)
VRKVFRIVADVYVDGGNLAEALIDSGMAVKHDGGKENTSWCE